MNRRALLASVGSSGIIGLSGCTSQIFQGSNNLPAIESKQLEIKSSQCKSEGERTPQASITYSESDSRLLVDGIIATPSECTDLVIYPVKGVGSQYIPDDAYRIVIRFGSGGSCKRCPAETSYSATIEFAHDPSAVSIYHTEEVGDDLRPLGPYASKQIR